jgi:hypothetical protein
MNNTYRAECIYNLESLLSEYGIEYSRKSTYRLAARGVVLSHNGEAFLADGVEFDSIFDLLLVVAEKAA